MSETLKVKDGVVVTLDYTLRLDDGEVIDSSADEGPLEYLHGYGQIIPTTGVDQYAATLAAWFGVAPADLSMLFPRLGEYDSQNLGFMQS